MYLDQSVSQHQTLNISAKLITSIKILQLSSQELEQAISQELYENPALELDEIPQCLRCGNQLKEGYCPTCQNGLSSSPSADHLNGLASEEDWEHFTSDGRINAGDDEEYDPLAHIQSELSLSETLLWSLHALLPAEDFVLAEYLVGSLDEHGYLTVDPQEIASILHISLEKVEAALALLQMQEPIGIGARNLSECLLMQLHFLRDQGAPQPLAELLVQHHLKQLGEHRFAEIAQSTATAIADIKASWRFIRDNLNPYPSHAFEGTSIVSVRPRISSIRPDVVIRQNNTGFEVEVVEGKKFHFRINTTYRSLISAMTSRYSDNDRQHIRHYTSRAQFFIDCLQQRWETLKKITDSLVDYQYEFLAKGVRYLRPLTRNELAARVGLHESTISRATANKYVLLPQGRTIPFEDFFDASLKTKDTLKEIIRQEDPDHPFSDEELASLLAGRGLSVARRTVAKYRESLHILPSRLRQ